mmetsp:Transcript_13789/g.19646  ORF Transcript_13789/g.19646 Transcript_13789/m.19646 type:complete len:304 (+) Transcript_13789:13-924(+)|eukprot:CAMPEP_0175099052 /NCGR_PEP_ID=MMETSP0086_2-20121207/6221_1 /TAXON_ID=136419 /ORGANISM="Unknown Unknown, Strain D1" /LENGTH=303 /DNA_ID=CAMNT_0016372817 /DNA_START=13 /DNA_END=924 /DNA_ORIENTATION=-
MATFARNLRQFAKPGLALAGTATGMFMFSKNNQANSAASNVQIPDFTPVTVLSAETETSDVKRVTFALPDKTRPLGHEAISAIMLKTQVGDTPVMKPYNPVGNKDGEFTLCVKKYSGAKMGSAVHRLVVGDTFLAKFGWQQFPYKANQFKQIAAIAGGTGATPLIQLTETIMANKDDKTKVTLIFANKTDADIFYKQQLDVLTTKNPDRLKVVYAVEHASADFWDSLLVPSRGIIGRVTKEVIQDHVHSSSASDSLVLVCGPGEMLKSLSGPKLFPKGGAPQQGPLKGILKDLGFSESNVFKV